LTFQEYLAGLALIAGPFQGYDNGSTLGERLSPLAGRVVESEHGGFEVTENWREAMLAVLHFLDGKEGDKTQSARTYLALFCLADEPNISEKVALDVVDLFIVNIQLQRVILTRKILHESWLPRFGSKLWLRN
jgi:hypothetical protein